MKISLLSKPKYVFSLVNPNTLDLQSDKINHFFSMSNLSSNDKLSNFGAWQEMVNDGYFFTVKEKVIENLIGITGMQKANRKDFIKYRHFLNSMNAKFRLGNFIYSKIRRQPILLADLGTVVDLSIIDHFQKIKSDLNILEIGGGYGRLACGFAVNANFASYNLVDVVPTSLTLAAIYLKKNRLNVEKGFSGAENKSINLLSLEDLINLPDESIDLVINLESFQEMTQDWVNFWVKVINDKTKPNSFFYNSNSYGYKNFFDLNLGNSWQLISSYNHPRHWTKEHRTEVWQRA